MLSKRVTLFLALVVMLGLLAACQPQTVEVTRVIQEEVTRVVTETIVEEVEEVASLPKFRKLRRNLKRPRRHRIPLLIRWLRWSLVTSAPWIPT